MLTYEVYELGADINGDGSVDLVDYALFAGQWGNDCAEPDWCDGADLDIGGAVGFTDLVKFLQDWLE